MDGLPEEIVKGAQPQAFVVGHFENAPDIGFKIVESIASTSNDSEHLKSIVFQVVTYDHEFLSKKAVQSGVGSASTDGILKANWMTKHHSLLPSVVVLLFAFDTDWVAGEQMKMENYMADTYSSIKTSISGRDAKILVVVVRQGAYGTDNLDKESVDEKYAPLKRRLNLDSRLFFVYTELADFSPQSAVARKLGKAVRECSNNYYKYQCKNYRRLEKLGTKTVQPLLFARYNFKAAVYCDFMGQTDKSLKHYQDSFYALATFSDGMDSTDTDQLHIVAGYLNFRICRLLLLTASINDVMHQFKVHLNLFGKKYGGNHVWRHYSWLANQYLICYALMDAHSVNPQSLDTDKKFFYLNAAKYTIKTSIECHKLSVSLGLDKTSESVLEEDLKVLYPEFETCPPIYCGGMPALLDRAQGRRLKLTKEGIQVVAKHWLREELKKDHSSTVFVYLNTVLETLDPDDFRFQQYVQSLIADQCLRDFRFDVAFGTYKKYAEICHVSGWLHIQISVLHKLMICAIHLKEIPVYLHSCLILYSIIDRIDGSSVDKESLKKDLAIILDAANFSDINQKVSQFSQYKCDIGPDKLLLIENYKCTQNISDGCSLSFDHSTFIIRSSISFSSTVLRFGDVASIKLNLSSIFEGTVSFDEIVLHFTKDVVVYRIDQLPESSISGSNSERNLSFQYQKDMLFDIQISITDEIVQKIGGDILAVEKIVYVKRDAGVSGSIQKVSEVDENDKTSIAISFEVNTSPRYSLQAPIDIANVLSLGELVEASSAWNCEFAAVNIPEASITMKSPAEIELLQGIIQRVDVVFRCDEHSGHNGKAFLYFDPPAESSSTTFFWYPSVIGGDFPESMESSDKLTFCPIALNDQHQPLYPFHVGDIFSGSDFTISLFVRQEIVCTAKFRIRIEYNPSSTSSIIVGKDFEIDCVSVRPLSVGFNLMSSREASCGISPENASSSVLRGDCIKLGSSISCTKQPKNNRELAILDIAFVQNDESAAVFRHLDNRSVDEELTGLVIRSSKDPAPERLGPITLLNSSEYFALSVNVLCLPEYGDNAFSKPMLPSPPITASVGAIRITWSLNDPHLIFPSHVSHSEISNLKSVDQFLKLANLCSFFVPEDAPQDPLDRSSVTLSSCVINFTVPSVQVFDAPFDVQICYPSIVSVGDLFKVVVTVKNKLLSAERISIAVNFDDNMFLTGPVSSALELLPHRSSIVEFSLVPLVGGQIKLPKIKLFWERHSLSILDFVKSIFVKPAYISGASDL